jgi:hypothetical protein
MEPVPEPKSFLLHNTVTDIQKNAEVTTYRGVSYWDSLSCRYCSLYLPRHFRKTTFSRFFFTLPSRCFNALVGVVRKNFVLQNEDLQCSFALETEIHLLPGTLLV